MELNEKMEIRVKRKAILWLASTVFSLFLVGLSGWVIKLHYDYQNIPSEHLIGNKVTNIKALKEKGFPFSFLVIGDTHNSNRATALIERALKAGESSFMVILGDFVNNPDIRQHLFFIKKMTGEIKPPFPVFLVPGNHDIDYGSKIKQIERRVTPEIYESLHGPRNFSFVFNHCLFIICGIDPRNRESYLDYLRKTLSDQGKGKRHIFVFMHNPPKGVAMAASFSLPNEEQFFSLLEAYQVTSCFFGDFHGYWRSQRRGTNLIVSGGGGLLKRWQPVWGKFHHIIRITVDKDMTTEGIITLPGEATSFSGTLKKWLFIDVFPLIQNGHWILYCLLIICSFWGIYSVVHLVVLSKGGIDRPA
jgi:hypothetical protein